MPKTGLFEGVIGACRDIQGVHFFVGRGAQELGTSTLGNKILAQVPKKRMILRYLEPVLGALYFK